MKTTKRLLTFGACLLMAGSSWAAEVWLRAAPTTITLPDGTATGRQVVMWGFAKDSNATTEDGVVTVPGPTIEVRGDAAGVPGDPTLTIHLKNYLPEPVSIVIPGQLGATLGNPVKFADASGRMRARSMTVEAPAYDGTTPGVADYIWSNVQPGTYLYHSGSHPAVQVQMGLYGAMTKLEMTTAAASKRAYKGVNYDGEVTLLYSEVDVDLHDAVATGNFGPGLGMTSALHSQPDYFLINGKPHIAGQPVLSLGESGRRVLFRFLNAGADSRIPILNGSHLQVVAENGKPYIDNVGESQWRNVYAVNLPAMQTVDALLPAAPLGVFPIYDRRLGLSDSAGQTRGFLAFVAAGLRRAYNGRTISITDNRQTAADVRNFAWPAGTVGTIGKVTVTLSGLSHPRLQDLDVLLVSPQGTPVLIMSDAGGTTSTMTAPVTLTFDDAAQASVPTSGVTSGTYLPTNIDSVDTFTGGAPAKPYGVSLSAFNGQNPAGTWTLYILDDQSGAGNGQLVSFSVNIAPKQ